MEVIREEGLQENALLVGSYLTRRLRELQVRSWTSVVLIKDSQSAS